MSRPDGQRPISHHVWACNLVSMHPCSWRCEDGQQLISHHLWAVRYEGSQQPSVSLVWTVSRPDGQRPISSRPCSLYASVSMASSLSATIYEPWGMKVVMHLSAGVFLVSMHPWGVKVVSSHLWAVRCEDGHVSISRCPWAVPMASDLSATIYEPDVSRWSREPSQWSQQVCFIVLCLHF